MYCIFSRRGSTPCPFFFFFYRRDLFDLLFINQQRVYLNELDVYLRKTLYSRGCLYSPLAFPWKRTVIKTDDIGVLYFQGDWKECKCIITILY